jgi:hypothetical protein
VIDIVEKKLIINEKQNNINKIKNIFTLTFFGLVSDRLSLMLSLYKK